jgi:hypothetical protein
MSVNKRTCLSIPENVEIIRELERGEKMIKFARNLIYSHLHFKVHGKTKKRFYLH